MKLNIKPIILLILIVLIGWMSYALYARTQAQALWGARTLVLFLAVWALLVVLFYPKNRWLAYATLSGTLLALGFPGWLPLPWLLFGSLVPLLQIVKELHESDVKRKGIALFQYSFHTFLLWNIGSTFWVANSSLPAGVFTLLANSFLMTLPFLTCQWTHRYLPRLGFLPLVAYWLSLEFLHFQWELNFPWLTLGNGWAQFPALIQWYDVTGVFGGSLWILFSNFLIFNFLKTRRPGKFPTRPAIGWLVWLAAPMLISIVQYSNYRESGSSIEVVTLQPGYEPHYAEARVPEVRKLDRYFTMAARELTPTTDYLLFPEATFGWVEVTQMPAYQTFEDIRSFGKDYPNLYFVTGVNAYRVLQPGEPDTEHTRVAYGNGNSMRYEAYNAAVQFNASFQAFPLHKKSKLVPGPESFPFQNALFFLKPLVARFGGTTAGLGTDDTTVVFRSPKATIAPIICYESVFGEYVTGYVRAGAQALFIMTNDGWWDDTPAHWQHLYFAALRAIETRRPIARAANTGNSAFINPRGDIVQHTTYGTDAVSRGTLFLNDQRTFYVKWGDLLARWSVVITLLLLLVALIKMFITKAAS